MKSAVAFFIYKRPEYAHKVWSEIRAARPPELLIIADGPREESDRQKCEATRAVVANVDWPCHVQYNYSDANMGCRDRMASGLKWVFEQVEECIILEDDCLPAPSFFSFCDEMLDQYRQDERVMHISGNNYFCEQYDTRYSYGFSKYSFSWGWATWRRAWRYFDLRISFWPEAKIAGLLITVCESANERLFWGSVFDRQHRGASRAWDYSWLCTCWMHHGLSVLPIVNLVGNIGTGSDSTHTQDGLWCMNRAVGGIGKIQHPSVMIVNAAADKLAYRMIFQPPFWGLLRETVLNPWSYASTIRRFPLIGPWWSRWREKGKSVNII